jgi:hypothetical protein
MPFVVRRPRGQWEIRESRWTPRGPRSRTLATFTLLTPPVVARARRAAAAPVSEEQLWDAARRAGAPARRSTADEAARILLTELAAGRPPAPGLGRLLAGRLATPPAHDLPGEGVIDWLAASPQQRGKALRDLLELSDRLPATPRRPLQFPSFRSMARDRA